MVQGRGKTLGAVDLHVASRVRERRIVLGISQRQMATALNLTFEQVHEYEQGRNRIGAGRGAYHILRGYYRYIMGSCTSSKWQSHRFLGSS